MNTYLGFGFYVPKKTIKLELLYVFGLLITIAGISLANTYNNHSPDEAILFRIK